MTTLLNGNVSEQKLSNSNRNAAFPAKQARYSNFLTALTADYKGDRNLLVFALLNPNRSLESCMILRLLPCGFLASLQEYSGLYD